MVTGAITGIGTAVPPAASQSELWRGFFRHQFSKDRRAQRIWEQTGVRCRGGAVTPLTEDVSDWGTEARMRRFQQEALPLGLVAVRRAMRDAGVLAADVDNFTVVSCTGYATPGLDVLVAGQLDMRPDTQRLHIGHMGCHAALPALATVADAAAARHVTSVLLCVELPSLHLQPPSGDVQQVVVHALFADAAAAVVVTPDRPGLRLVDFAARTDATHATDMRWDVTDHGFRMKLSPVVPKVLAHHVRDVVARLLTANGLAIPDVARWVVHPGGPKIIDVVADRLGLTGQLDPSRQVLTELGNCSSGSVLLILERILRSNPPGPGDHLVMIAFGPGLTLCATLLRCTG